MQKSDTPYFLSQTIRYYARWTGVEPEAFQRRGIHTVCSPERDVRQAGYSAPFHLYCVIAGNAIVLSYNRRIASDLEEIAEIFKNPLHWPLVEERLSTVLHAKVSHSLKFVFQGLNRDIDTSEAVRLSRYNYPEYERFYRAAHSIQSPVGEKEWLEAYFDTLADRGYCYGIFQDGHLVSATDAPDIPYMNEVIVEPGIHTLRDYRGRGYAKTVVAAMLDHLLRTGKVPIWSAGAKNIASQKLAECVGYTAFAHVLTVTLES